LRAGNAKRISWRFISASNALMKSFLQKGRDSAEKFDKLNNNSHLRVPASLGTALGHSWDSLGRKRFLQLCPDTMIEELLTNDVSNV